MKKLTIFLCLLCAVPAWSYDFIFATHAETLFVTGNSMNLSGTYSKPDSIRLRVYQNATELSKQTYGWGSGFVDTVDTQSGHDAIHIHIPFDSLDGATSSGIYQIYADFKKNGQDSTAWTAQYSVYVGYPDVNMVQISDSRDAADNLEKLLYSSSDSAALYAANFDAFKSDGDTNQVNVSTLTEESNIGINWDDIANPGANVNLSATTIKYVDWLAGLRTGAIGDSSYAADAITPVAVKSSTWDEMWEYDTSSVSAGMGGMLKDTSAYQGSGSLTSAQDAKLDSIYLSVGAIDTSSEAAIQEKLGAYSGAAGDNNNIKDDIAAISTTGGGTEPETLIVLNTADSTQIQGAVITVRTLDQSTVKVDGLATDVNGRRILELDAGSFYVAITANNYAPCTDTVAVASGGGTDTLWMTQFDPGSPENLDLCRVYGWVYDINGDSLSGIEITAEIPRSYHPVKYGNVVITPFSTSDTTDSSGYWHIDLIPSSDLSGTAQYMFTVKYSSGVIYRTQTTVPDSSSWQLQ